MKHIATWMRECDAAHFERIFGAFPEVRLWNARTAFVPWQQMQGLMLTGGSDISPEFLRQPIPDLQLIEDPDPMRDKWEFEILEKALNQRMPLLGICRGLQVINVALGGTLHLNIPNHDSARYENIQELRYTPDVPIQFFQVNSSHHQALAQLGTGLVVEGRCREDDVIEQARLADYPFGLGVQYHPERDLLYQSLFQAFIEQVPPQTQ